MGLFSLRPAGRFVDGISGDIIESQATVLLAAFFEAMRARAIHLVTGTPQILVDLIEKETGKPFAPSPGTGERRKGGEVLSPKSAVQVCASRLREFPQLPNISGGISFGLGGAPDNPRNSWQLLLHRGPLPLLSLEISDGSAFKPPKDWEEVLISCGAAHFVYTKAGNYFGAGDSIYLLKKKQKIFPNSKGRSTDDALKSGLCIRHLCSDVWSERPEAKKPYRLSSWKRTQKRFMKSFDEALQRKMVTEELNRILTLMGTDLPEWLNASD